MKGMIWVAGQPWALDLAAPIDIALDLDPYSADQPQAFSLPRASAAAVELGSFVGDTRRGGSCNCEVLTIYPHGNGTHTECIGHISRERIGVRSVLAGAFFPATLVTVRPEPFSSSLESYPTEHGDEECAITRAGLERALAALPESSPGFLRALIIRTLPNSAAKRSCSYSGANPVYLAQEAMECILALGVEHLLVDLPSVDREDDGGRLPMHCLFWGLAPDRCLTQPVPGRSITELVYVDSATADGIYLLNLQIPPIALDAVPSRPLLFPLTGG